MDLPIEVIEAVKQPTPEPKAKPKAKAKPKKRAPKFKKLPNRILQAVGSGLRTSTAIANALNVPKQRVQSSLWNLKSRGLILATKQAGKTEYKYHLDTGKDVYNKAGVNTTNSFNTPPKVVTPVTTAVKEMKGDIDRYIQRISNLEHTLSEKEKEVWSLECEVFDKKAIIKYLEDKLFQLGVRV